MKKTYLPIIIILLVAGGISTWSQEPTPGPEIPGIGALFFVPADKVHTILDLTFIDSGIPPIQSFPIVLIGPYTFTTEVHFNSGDDVIAAYGFTITFDDSIVVINTDKGLNGVSAGTEGFVAAVNAGNPGGLSVSGFDTSGKGPGPDLHLITIHWLAQTYDGTTTVTLTPDTLADSQGNTIGSPSTINGTITIVTVSCVLGDLNNDGEVDIVDALLAAQWYVGLNPSGVDIICGDVNGSGSIDIIDALLIAQYYVGLISSFP